MTRRTSFTWLAVQAILLSGCGDVVYVTRQAKLVGHVVTSSGRLGVPCTASALLFGDEYSSASVTSGGAVALAVGMLTPLRIPGALRANVAVRVQCEGHQTLTTPERSTEVTWFRPPTVEFGTLTVSEAR